MGRKAMRLGPATEIRRRVGNYEEVYPLDDRGRLVGVNEVGTVAPAWVGCVGEPEPPMYALIADDIDWLPDLPSEDGGPYL